MAGGLVAGAEGVTGGFAVTGFSDFGAAAAGIASDPGSASVGSVIKMGAVGRGFGFGGAVAEAASTAGAFTGVVAGFAFAV
jgi:hypothetical protein